MEFIDKELILKEIPFFESMSQEEREILKERSSIAEYKKGALIYTQGSPADAFYCVVLGRVVLFTLDATGNETVLEYLHRGTYFGIISLLTGDAHSVTARALNDCILLVIRKEDFDSTLKLIPRLAIDLSVTLSRRLKSKDIREKKVFESTIISVFSSYAQAGKSVYALNLALSLKKETHKSVIILDICALDTTHNVKGHLGITQEVHVFALSTQGINAATLKAGILKSGFGLDCMCVTYDPHDESCAKKLVGMLSILVSSYHYIFLDLPSSMDHGVFSMLNQADLIHVLTSPDPVDLKRTSNLMTRLQNEFAFQESKIKVVINEYKTSRLTHAEQLEYLGYPIFATLPRIEFTAADRPVLDDPQSEYAKTVRRIARQLGDRFVGLVLGVGVGYGFCHIGVLKVLEEEKIPIDIIAGASIGALIASLWAIGKSSDEILEITGEFRGSKNVWGLVDLTVPFVGFIKGKKLYNFLKRHLGNKTFYDVKFPLKVVASDIKKKEPIIIDKGPLVEAIMASCSMPGVFRPFRFKEDILFDGGVIYPLPTEPLFKMGVNKIIAVNVTPSREDVLSQRVALKEQITAAYGVIKKKQWMDVRTYFAEKFKNNILDAVFSSIEIMQSEMAQQEGRLADIVLHPDTRGMHWLELNRAKEFAARGEEVTRKNLEKIRQIVNE